MISLKKKRDNQTTRVISLLLEGQPRSMHRNLALLALPQARIWQNASRSMWLSAAPACPHRGPVLKPGTETHQYIYDANLIRACACIARFRKCAKEEPLQSLEQHSVADEAQLAPPVFESTKFAFSWKR